MAEIRRDPATSRWVIVSTDNPRHPADFEKEITEKSNGACPFCPGNERMTPQEILADRESGGQPNNPPWSLRVIPNKFPALRIEGGLDRSGLGIYDRMNGIGAHEVIIETPVHTKRLADFQPQEMERLFQVFVERSLDLRKDKRFRYLLIFKNEGMLAGASLTHSHSQIIALPIIPKRVSEEMRNYDEYFEQKERCVFCDILQQELQEKNRVVLESPNTLCFAPYASRFPFELWILPKTHLSDFAETPKELLTEAGNSLRQVLGKMRSVLGNDHPYNFLIHTSPLAGTSREGYHWHLEIMPRLTRVAGFEWGSGFYINPTPPELAAQYLRGEKTI